MLRGDRHGWFRMNTFLILALCGAAGALIYGVPVYLSAISQTPPARFALTHLIATVATGTICGAIFTRIIGHHFTWTVEPEPYPLALVIGLASNPIIPILQRKLLDRAEKMQ